MRCMDLVEWNLFYWNLERIIMYIWRQQVNADSHLIKKKNIFLENNSQQ